MRNTPPWLCRKPAVVIQSLQNEKVAVINKKTKAIKEVSTWPAATLNLKQTSSLFDEIALEFAQQTNLVPSKSKQKPYQTQLCSPSPQIKGVVHNQVLNLKGFLLPLPCLLVIVTKQKGTHCI